MAQNIDHVRGVLKDQTQDFDDSRLVIVELQKDVPMQAMDPRLKMTAANGSAIENLGTKLIRFRGAEPDFSRRT